MKDHIVLIVAALVVSILVWSFWHYLEDDAFNVLMLVFLLVLAVDNYQLRKKLKNKTTTEEYTGIVKSPNIKQSD